MILSADCGRKSAPVGLTPGRSGKGGHVKQGGEGGIEKLYNFLKKGNFICRKGGTVTSQHAKLIVYLATPFLGQNSNVFKANLAKK